jgi:hypothetical protein
VDPYTGRIVDLRFAGYMVPVNPDVPKLDVSFAEDVAPVINPLGARGIGELPMAGVATAIANEPITQPASACASCRSGSRMCSVAIVTL